MRSRRAAKPTNRYTVTAVPPVHGRSDEHESSAKVSARDQRILRRRRDEYARNARKNDVENRR